ncbi:MAG TPA: ATP-binding protein [Gemmatimonadaceae bacterium]|nr:ATP-binding protein [Gemmatimonadaceae bacterium]
MASLPETGVGSALRTFSVGILTPSGNDAQLAVTILSKARIEVVPLPDMQAMCSAIERGIGAVVVAEEALRGPARSALSATLDAQPEWSDLPVILLLARGELSGAIAPGVADIAVRANVTLLERPVRVATLTTTLRSALRARARQYDVRDSITERAASEQRLHAMVYAAPYPLMLHAQDGEVLQLSRAWSDLTGYRRDELTTTGEWTALAYEDPAKAEAVVRHDLERLDDVLGTPRDLGEREVRTRTGDRRIWSFQSVSLGRLPDGRKLRLVAAVDVTEMRVLIEREREARMAAEDANRAKMEFLAVMSHELRTPLNAIGGYTQLLELGIHGPITESQRDALARIRRSETHLLGLIEDVLNFAKIEAGRVTFDLEEVDAGTLLDGVHALVAPQMLERGLRYARTPSPEVRLTTDVEKARQILLNLLSNAVKFTPSGGEIRVDFGVRPGWVDICVSDTGIGIAADKVDAVFEPFVQVRSYSSGQGGTGLGLAISRDLAKAMAGELSVRSALGKGSTFTLSLPVASGERPGAARPSAALREDAAR